MTSHGRANRPVGMLVHSYYEEDPRVRREAETLVAAGRRVVVFSLRRPGDPVTGELAGVQIRRLDVQRHQGASLGTYLREYAEFFGRAGWAATSAHRQSRFALLQIHTVPDFLSFAGLPMRLSGVPLVIDLHEAMPEFFRMRFPRASNPLVQRALRLQERLAIGAADAAITVNEALAERLVRLGVDRAKVTVILNSPDLARFDPGLLPRRGFMADGRLRLVYAGALTPTYELEVAIAALGVLAERRPELATTLDLYGRGDAQAALERQAEGLGVADRVTFHGRIPIEDVPAAIAEADIGLAPTRRSPFTDFSLSTKIFEYGAMTKPVVASRLPMVERTFPAGSVATYEPGSADEMATAILRLVDEPLEREVRLARTGERVDELAWAHEGRRYRELIERLIARGRGAAEPAMATATATPGTGHKAGAAAASGRPDASPVTDAATAAATDGPKALDSPGGPSSAEPRSDEPPFDGSPGSDGPAAYPAR